MFISINRLKVKPEGTAIIEERFAEKKGLEESPGFIRFELLERTWNPHGGEADYVEYLAMTVWRSEADFRSWIDSPAFATAHGGPKLDIFAGPGEPAGYAVKVTRRPETAQVSS